LHKEPEKKHQYKNIFVCVLFWPTVNPKLMNSEFSAKNHMVGTTAQQIQEAELQPK